MLYFNFKKANIVVHGLQDYQIGLTNNMIPQLGCSFVYAKALGKYVGGVFIPNFNFKLIKALQIIISNYHIKTLISDVIITNLFHHDGILLFITQYSNDGDQFKNFVKFICYSIVLFSNSVEYDINFQDIMF